MIARNLAKKIFYAINPPRLEQAKDLTLGYVFHTEMIYEKKYFDALMDFLPRYTALTGARAIATLMSGRNPRVRDGIKSAGISELEFASRLAKIGEVAELGFHGHYVLEAEEYKTFSKQIRGAVYEMEVITNQLKNELAWFEEFKIKLGPYYSAGWWFHSLELYQELALRGFRYDFSQSFSPWFRSPVIYPILKEMGLHCGERVELDFGKAKIQLIQNLVGCHNTKFSEDFIRHMKALLNGGSDTPVAVVHSHDFDLQVENSLHALADIKKLGANFFSGTDLDSMAPPKIGWRV